MKKLTLTIAYGGSKEDKEKYFKKIQEYSNDKVNIVEADLKKIVPESILIIQDPYKQNFKSYRDTFIKLYNLFGAEKSIVFTKKQQIVYDTIQYPQSGYHQILEFLINNFGQFKNISKLISYTHQNLYFINTFNNESTIDDYISCLNENSKFCMIRIEEHEIFENKLVRLFCLDEKELNDIPNNEHLYKIINDGLIDLDKLLSFYLHIKKNNEKLSVSKSIDIYSKNEYYRATLFGLFKDVMFKKYINETKAISENVFNQIILKGIKKIIDKANTCKDVLSVMVLICHLFLLYPFSFSLNIKGLSIELTPRPTHNQPLNVELRETHKKAIKYPENIEEYSSKSIWGVLILFEIARRNLFCYYYLGHKDIYEKLPILAHVSLFSHLIQQKMINPSSIVCKKGKYHSFSGDFRKRIRGVYSLQCFALMNDIDMSGCIESFLNLKYETFLSYFE